jgi:hypothetical protein
MSRLRSRSSKSWRMRSRSCSASTAFEEIRRPAHDQAFVRVALVLPDRHAAFDQFGGQRVEFLAAATTSRGKRSRSSASVLPSASALRKFAASRMEEGVWPGGGVKTRFSTWPSAKTSTTSARSARGSRIRCGESAPRAWGENEACATSDPTAPRRSGRAWRRRRVRWNQRGVEPSRGPRRRAAPTSSRPSTNMRRPSWVGTRPAETCGLPSRPRYSRSCMTLRIVAALTCSDMVRVSVREPDGIAGIEIALDDPPEDLAAAVVHLLRKLRAVVHRMASSWGDPIMNRSRRRQSAAPGSRGCVGAGGSAGRGCSGVSRRPP